VREVFEAAAPAGVGEEKYDERAAPMIGLLQYGSGVPWDRLERLEASVGIPLAVPGVSCTSGVSMSYWRRPDLPLNHSIEQENLSRRF
jgi:hypothetical protein